jgi:hypothetical protein
MDAQRMLNELKRGGEDYRRRKAIEDATHSCLCQKAGDSTEDCPWKCPTWAEPQPDRRK